MDIVCFHMLSWSFNVFHVLLRFHAISIDFQTFAGRAAPEEAEDGSDSEDEPIAADLLGEEPPVVMPAPDPMTGVYDEESIPTRVKEAHAIACVEMVGDLKKEIVALQDEDKHPEIPEVEPKDPLSPFGGPDEAPRDSEERFPNTLGQILTQANLRTYKPPKPDSVLQSLERIRALAAPIRSFVRKARLNDKILSRSQILGKLGRHCGKHHHLEAVLARLRRKYSLNSQRQSRFTAWAYFSKMISQSACKDGFTAKPVSQFIPSCAMLSDGARKYQVTVIRTHVLGKAMFCLTEEVIRGSLTHKGRRTGKKLSELPVDPHMVASIRGVILEPAGSEKNADGMWPFRCTCKSVSGIFSITDEEGSLLWMVPDDMFTVKETNISLEFLVHDKAVETMLLFQSGQVPNMKTKPTEAPSTLTSYTVDTFRQRKNVLAYVDVVRKLLQKTLGTMFWNILEPSCFNLLHMNGCWVLHVPPCFIHYGSLWYCMVSLWSLYVIVIWSLFVIVIH